MADPNISTSTPGQVLIHRLVTGAFNSVLSGNEENGQEKEVNHVNLH